MIECPACGKKYRSGTLFCTECGTYLPSGGSLRTTPLPTNRIAGEPREPPETGALPKEKAPPPRFVHIQVVETGRRAVLALGEELVIGRRDPVRGIFPDLDLTADGGVERGVSRRHARILRKGERIYIEDIGSANSTFLNDQRLMPYLPYPLKDGDRVRLGRLELEIHFQSE